MQIILCYDCETMKSDPAMVKKRFRNDFIYDGGFCENYKTKKITKKKNHITCCHICLRVISNIAKNKIRKLVISVFFFFIILLFN